MGRNRIYSEGKLVTWSQPRCKICGRFLSLRQSKYCVKHGVGTKNYFKNNKDSYHKYNKVYRMNNTKKEWERQTLQNEIERLSKKIIRDSLPTATIPTALYLLL